MLRESGRVLGRPDPCVERADPEQPGAVVRDLHHVEAVLGVDPDERHPGVASTRPQPPDLAAHGSVAPVGGAADPLERRRDAVLAVAGRTLGSSTRDGRLDAHDDRVDLCGRRRSGQHERQRLRVGQGLVTNARDDPQPAPGRAQRQHPLSLADPRPCGLQVLGCEVELVVRPGLDRSSGAREPRGDPVLLGALEAVGLAGPAPQHPLRERGVHDGPHVVVGVEIDGHLAQQSGPRAGREDDVLVRRRDQDREPTPVRRGQAEGEGAVVRARWVDLLDDHDEGALVDGGTDTRRDDAELLVDLAHREVRRREQGSQRIGLLDHRRCGLDLVALPREPRHHAWASILSRASSARRAQEFSTTRRPTWSRCTRRPAPIDQHGCRAAPAALAWGNGP
ncbi:hypothetical protein GALL_406780 [mine drainage metagenome]|uniref:Uncharacterized protein n=1 Tax=mine drainage metagenome TaxID=410659 RepID=A0A1J5QCB6_9ZZZZ